MKRSRFSQFLYVVFRKDIGRKTMALALALVFWLILDQKVVLRQPHRVPVVVVSGMEAFHQRSGNTGDTLFIVLAEDLMLMESLKENYLDITLSGPKELIQSNLTGRKDIATRDMNGLDERPYPVSLIREYFDLLRNNETIGVEFEPSNFTLRLAQRASLEIVLNQDHMALRGIEELRSKGIDLEDVIFDPNTITIEGPAPVIQEIQAGQIRFMLNSMELRAQSNISRDISLSPELLNRKVTIQGRQFVRVRVQLSEEEIERIVDGVKVHVFFGNRPLSPEEAARIELEQENVGIKFTGPRSQIDLLASDEKLRTKLMAVVNLADVVEAEKIGEVSLEEIIAQKLSIPFDVQLYPDSTFRFSPLNTIRIEPVARTIFIGQKAVPE